MKSDRRWPVAIIGGGFSGTMTAAQLAQDPFMKKVMDSQKEWVRRVVYYNMTNATDFDIADV